MQLDIPTTDSSDEMVVELEDFNLGKEIGKSLVLSTAETAGIAAGFILVAFAFDAGTKLYNRFKKTKPELTVVADLPEANEA